MDLINAVSLSVSQVGNQARCVAYLSETEGDKHIMLRVDWPAVAPARQDGGPAEWLYQLLSHLVEDFDNYEDKEVAVEGVELMQEGTQDA